MISILLERFESCNLSVYMGGIGGFAAAQSSFGSFVLLIQAVFQVLLLVLVTCLSPWVTLHSSLLLSSLS